jgi:hexosaminidase
MGAVNEMPRRVVKLVVLLLVCIPALSAVDSDQRPALALVPMPREVRVQDGGFRLSPKTRILVQFGHQSEDRIAAETLAEEISDEAGLQLDIVGMKPKGKAEEGAIVLARLQDKRVRRFLAAKGLTADDLVGEQGYLLYSDNTHLIVAANSGQGIFYGVQTLRQLLRQAPKGPMMCPAVAIRDWPDLERRHDDQHWTRDTPPAFTQQFVRGPRS